jgi:cytidylate kinase
VVGIPANFADRITKFYDDMGQKLTVAAPKKDTHTSQILVGERDMVEALATYNKQMAIENISSVIAATPEMRTRLYSLWRDAAERFGGIVVVGRKTGVDLFPQAQLKVFLYADPEASATYRLHRNIMATSQVYTESSYVAGRDNRDRANGLLDQPEDALVIDTTNYLQDKMGLDNLANLVKFHLESKYAIR